MLIIGGGITGAGIAREAAADNARRTDAVLKQLRRSAPEGAEIHTGSYSLAPEYEYVTREGRRVRELAGYVASSRVTVVTSDLDGVGTLIDEAIGSGADEIGSIEFFLADQAGARRQAMLEAGRNARVDAATLAESLGVGLGPLIEAYTVEASSPVRSSTMRMAAAADMAADVPTPISPGSVAVGVTVTAVFSVQ